jgi:hypothetical protein
MLMVMAPIMCAGGVIMALREGQALSLAGRRVPVMAVVIDHEDLLRRHGVYYALYVSQFTEAPAEAA